ncbi:MAG: hypothetical protein JWN75_380 [Candidatus Saccharibacteria bacterium]|nr:hypothetical protein [Candidatus Saccharibacteria bacterium]
MHLVTLPLSIYKEVVGEKSKKPRVINARLVPASVDSRG